MKRLLPLLGAALLSWSAQAEPLAFGLFGDTHQRRIDQPLADPDTGETVRNFTRVETVGSPFFGWIRGQVDAADPRVFSFSPRVWRSP